MISPNADNQLKRKFVLLGTLKYGNNKNDILTGSISLLDQLYKDKK